MLRRETVLSRWDIAALCFSGLPRALVMRENSATKCFQWLFQWFCVSQRQPLSVTSGVPDWKILNVFCCRFAAKHSFLRWDTGRLCLSDWPRPRAISISMIFVSRRQPLSVISSVPGQEGFPMILLGSTRNVFRAETPDASSSSSLFFFKTSSFCFFFLFFLLWFFFFFF